MSGEDDKDDQNVIDMSRDEKTGRFMPGKSGNPAGMPPISKYVKYLKFLDSKRYEQINRFVSSMSFLQLKTALDNADHPDNPYDVFELGIMSIWANIIARGDERRLEAILNRMIGVNHKKFSPTKDQEDMVKQFLALPREERQKEIERLDKLAQEVGDE